MGKLINIVTKLHNKTKRDYLARMLDNKTECMKIAKKYQKDYWDGQRRFGYGGYKYIPGRWNKVAKDLIEIYKLKPGSKILDVGCGKGFLLYEMKLLEPNLDICGFDMSKYAIKNAKKEIKRNLFVHKAQDPYAFKNKEFDLVFSLGTLHNLNLPHLKFTLSEIERVGKKKYIMVESYKNEKELFNLQCWALTCNIFFNNKEWIWFLKNLNIMEIMNLFIFNSFFHFN